MTRSNTANPLECFFLGTGTSTGLPLTPCLTLTSDYQSTSSKSYTANGEWPRNVRCGSCRSAVSSNDEVPEGWKNRRGNTSMVIRKKVKGRWLNVVLDVGKTFRENAARFFPVWGVQTIDAVVLTHGHADAFFGMDDLREWCMRQGTTIPVYLNRPTYETVAGAFPYMVDKTRASGGGDVPSLDFRIIEDDDEFDVCGINVRSFTTHHGIYFSQPAEPQVEQKSPKPLPKQVSPKETVLRPLVCLGFVFDSSVVYMGDVSDIPDKSWRMLESLRPTPTTKATGDCKDKGKGKGVARTSLEASVRDLQLQPNLTTTNGQRIGNGTFTPTTLAPLILVIDSLWPTRTHTSHYNFPQALSVALRLRTDMAYLLGFTHPTSHYQWEELCLSLRGLEGKRPNHPDAEIARQLIEDVWADGQFKRDSFGDRLKAWGGRVEPAWDGLKLQVATEGWTEVKTRAAKW